MPNLLIKQALLTLLSSLILLITPYLSFSQSLIWSEPIEVASGLSASIRPRIALDNQDNPIVIFAQNSNPNQNAIPNAGNLFRCFIFIRFYRQVGLCCIG